MQLEPNASQSAFAFPVSASETMTHPRELNHTSLVPTAIHLPSGEKSPVE